MTTVKVTFADQSSQIYVFPSMEIAQSVIETIQSNVGTDITVEYDPEIAEPETVPTSDPYICYLLMRSDVPSFINGKAMAQSHHNGTAMIWRAVKKQNPVLMQALSEWLEEADGFGTTICLEVNAPQMRQALSIGELTGLYVGLVNDPTYPIKDGDNIKTLPIDTCAFIFGRHSQAKLVVKGLNLFP